MAPKTEQKKVWDEFGACDMATGSMHQDVAECSGCEYCEHEGRTDE